MNSFYARVKEVCDEHIEQTTEDGFKACLQRGLSELVEKVAREAFDAGGTVLRGGDHKYDTFEDWLKEQGK